MLRSPFLILGRVSLDDLRQSGNPVQPILQDSWWWAMVWLVLAVAGVVVQVRASRDYEFTPDRYVEGGDEHQTASLGLGVTRIIRS